MVWARNCSVSRDKAMPVRVKTTRPLVSLSMRWTTPRLAWLRREVESTRRRRAWASRSSDCSVGACGWGTVRSPAGLLRMAICSSKYTRFLVSSRGSADTRGAERRSSMRSPSLTIWSRASTRFPFRKTLPVWIQVRALFQGRSKCCLTALSSRAWWRAAGMKRSGWPSSEGLFVCVLMGAEWRGDGRMSREMIAGVLGLGGVP